MGLSLLYPKGCRFPTPPTLGLTLYGPVGWTPDIFSIWAPPSCAPPCPHLPPATGHLPPIFSLQRIFLKYIFGISFHFLILLILGYNVTMSFSNLKMNHANHGSYNRLFFFFFFSFICFVYYIYIEVLYFYKDPSL